MIITSDGSPYELNLIEGETIYARLRIKGAREPFVFNLKPSDGFGDADIRVFLSTEMSTPSEQFNEGTFDNVSIFFG